MSDQQNADPAPETGKDIPIPPPEKPTETVDFWKQQARTNEARAKANAEAAKRLQELEDAQKSEQQRHADAAAAAQKERDEARAEALRYKAAATHRVDPEYIDLLAGSSEEEIADRASRLGALLAAKAENEQLKADLEALRQGKPAPAGGRPVPALKPGATPEDGKTEEDLLYESLFPAR